MNYDAVVVGGGIAGLTAAAYLCKEGYQVLLCEKEPKVGGLVNSFEYKGFTFDGGIRALENSGIVNPMLEQLGIDVEMVQNTVSIGIEDKVVKVATKENLKDYQQMLIQTFPENKVDIENIMKEIKKIMKYLDVLYGIRNPLFLDIKKDRDYFIKTVFPWMFKYMMTIGKIDSLNEPVNDYLKKFTSNQALIDMIGQHFFQQTPTFFALSYFTLYLEYEYPLGGTGSLIKAMESYILEHGGTIKTNTMITSVDPQRQVLIDENKVEYGYQQLVWASDLKALYQNIDIKTLRDEPLKKNVVEQQSELSDKVGGDSILTLYLTVDLDKSYFEKRTTEHCFYTPLKTGLSSVGMCEQRDKESIISWLKQYFKQTTYEISIPVMRDERLAPPGQTGLIISTLMDYSLVKHISEMGFYNELKQLSYECILETLEQSIFPGVKANVMDQFVATPLTIQRYTSNSDGAITGWAFTNSNVPAESKMTKVSKSVLTPLPNVYQAGQWTFSPAGLPISILTGKLAADKALKHLKV